MNHINVFANFDYSSPIYNPMYSQCHMTVGPDFTFTAKLLVNGEPDVDSAKAHYRFI